MITADSRRVHHVDTRRSRLTLRDLQARDNERRDADTLVLRDQHDSDHAYLDETPMPPPIVRCPPRARPPVWIRAWRAVRRAVLGFIYANEVACLQAERRHYAKSQHPRIGADFRRSSDEQLRDLRNRQAWLEIES